MCQMRKRVTLGLAPFVSDLFIAPGEGHRLKCEQRYLFRIVERELNDAADLFVVDAIDDRDHRHDTDAGIGQILDRAQLYIEKISYAAMRVRAITDAVELQISIAQSGRGRGGSEFGAASKFDPVRGRLDHPIANLAGVANGCEKIGREGRLTTGELDRQLAARPDGDRIVEQLTNRIPVQLVDESDLIGIHEAWITHHVAAIGEIDSQHRATAILNRTAAVMVQHFIAMSANIATGKNCLEMFEKR